MKEVRNLQVVSVETMNTRCVRLRLTDPTRALPPILPGQFVEVQAPANGGVLLRRPISVNFVDTAANQLHLLVQVVGDGTRALAEAAAGSQLSVLLPLGHGFSTDVKSLAPSATSNADANADAEAGTGPLLVGGGVGVAPLLYYGSWLRDHGVVPTFLLGGRTRDDVLLLPDFKRLGEVFVTTDDGSLGERGFVSQHSILQQRSFSRMAVCGPKPMMMSMARLARLANMPCEVSLENRMACGLGACLCCVEKTVRGNVCVCTEGPVFNIDELNWLD